MLRTIIHRHEAGTDFYSELVDWNLLDEPIAVICSNEPKSDIYRFEIMKSALERSPVLAEFFKSSDYRYGCGMMLKFPEDLAICFHAVKDYVEQGPDIYDAAALKKYATVGNAAPAVETFTFLVRLHKLANKLELRGLKDTTLVVLHQVELSMMPESCTALADLVLKDEPCDFQDVIKAFVIKHVGNYFEDLERSREWKHVVADSSNEFQVKWAKMTIAHHDRPLSSGSDINAEGILSHLTNTNTKLTQLIHEANEANEAGVARNNRLNQIVQLAHGERSPCSSIDTTATAIHDRINEASDEEDPTTPKASEINGESSRHLGLPIMERGSFSGEYRRPFYEENAKSR